MVPKPGSPFRKYWLQWKSLRLPWRKRFLVGLDLQGNTYWEFRMARGDDHLKPNAPPFRRIIHYPRSTHYSDVKVPPDWHQWLRYQREHPPTMQEQSAERARQERIKVLAAEADARWEAKPSLLDMPEKRTTQKTLPDQAIEDIKQEAPRDEKTQNAATTETQTAYDPWRRAARGGPSESWQPESWSPTSTKPR
ncbi:hypothetical protein GGR57DRAFT_496761 [Xylariaceae sp. FL1272]|nr:hypothetical protein GGR57DRAFT_496761 [Xylariaceae sp. FL1272]